MARGGWKGEGVFYGSTAAIFTELCKSWSWLSQSIYYHGKYSNVCEYVPDYMFTNGDFTCNGAMIIDGAWLASSITDP